MVFGVVAGSIGIILAVLFLLDVLPYSQFVEHTHNTTYAIICIVANAIGLGAGLLVRKRHFLASIIMAAVMVVVVCFGFPWQVIPAVMYIISVVMAVVPEKLHE